MKFTYLEFFLEHKFLKPKLKLHLKMECFVRQFIFTKLLTLTFYSYAKVINGLSAEPHSYSYSDSSVR